MSAITNGTVRYERTVKTGDYENKKAAVELVFSVEDGESHEVILNSALKTAHDKVHQTLGIKSASASAASVPATDAPPKAAPVKPKTRTKADIEAEHPANAKAVETKQAISTGAERVDPAAVTDASEVQDDLLVGAQADITDKFLQESVAAVYHRTKNKPAIMKLIGKHAGVGKSAHDTPQAVRQLFLDELNAIQPLA